MFIGDSSDRTTSLIQPSAAKVSFIKQLDEVMMWFLEHELAVGRHKTLIHLWAAGAIKIQTTPGASTKADYDPDNAISPSTIV
jgi:hypothetical protein